MTYAYRNSSGDIVALSTAERTLEEAQSRNPDIVTIDADPPQADVDEFEEAQQLSMVKASRFSTIDSKTDDLIAQGFTYNGKKFSLSLASQMKMMGAHEARDDAAMTYPIVWNTLGDDDVYAIQNSDDLHGFYLTGVGTVRARLDSGTALKNQVRNAATLAEVAAITDDR